MGEIDFYEAVRERERLDPAAADAATLATLSVLGDHLADTVVEDLTDPLPAEAAEAFLDAAADPPDEFDYGEFADRVADRLDVDPGTAEHRARAVGATLAERVDDEDLRAARDQLPDAYDRLFWMPEASDLLETVRDESGVESNDEAREVTTAALATLGERITPGQAEKIAAYIPEEFATALAPDEREVVEAVDAETETADREDGEAVDTDAVAADYDADEFVDRVAERADVDRETARESVGAVSEALAESVPRREFEDLLQQLPDEYGGVL